MMSVVIERPEDVAAGERLDEIGRKLDLLAQNVAALGEQVQFLTEKAYDDRRRQRV
ncbi:MAG: hypothetical protein R3A10_01035 [Caldilineaceae bacterium]